MKYSKLSVKFGIDGVLTFGAVSIAMNNNNLFAQRLGATDLQLSLLMFLPQIISLFLLLPVGMMTDSLSNKRRLLSLVLVLSGLFFGTAGFTPFVPLNAVWFFLAVIAAATVFNGITNLAWQSYFPEVVPEDSVTENRNDILTFRAKMTMIVQLVLPIAIGAILTAIPSEGGKIAAHQLFYILAAVLLISNAIHFRKIKAVKPAEPKRASLAEFKTAASRLTKNKPYIYFCLIVLFFHMTWQMDWTLYFISQRNYMQMNELLLSLTPVTATVTQLLTLKYWSRNNEKQGVQKPVAYGIFGLALCPVAVILGVSIPHGGAGIAVFLTIHAIGHLTFANIALNLFQCLLKVVDEEYRSVSISVYTLLITLSNAVMPMAGVLLYRALGGDRTAIVNTFAILFVLRVIAGGMWLLYVKKGEKNEHGRTPQTL